MRGSFNYARRPFQDDRPVYAVAGVLCLLGAVLLVVNIRLYTDFRRQVADTDAEIAALEARGLRAAEKAQAAKTALGSYRLTALAEESRGLARIVAERRFSWTGLLGRLERTLPSEVGLGRLQPRFGTTGETGLEMQLFARDKEAIVKTIAALSKDPAFGKVEVQSESQKEAGGPEPIDFTLSAGYEPEPPPAPATARAKKDGKPPAGPTKKDGKPPAAVTKRQGKRP
jgi:Tfp pilus assembly protein PilN